MTEQLRLDLTNAAEWLDALIEASEVDTLEILQSCLYYLFTEGGAPIPADELAARIKGAISRIESKAINELASRLNIQNSERTVQPQEPRE